MQKNEDFCFILKKSLNDEKFGFAEGRAQVMRNLPYDVSMDPDQWWMEVQELIDNLNLETHTLLKPRVHKLLTKSPTPELRNIFIGILTKKPRLGVNVKTVNDVIPGLIKTFSLMLAHPLGS